MREEVARPIMSELFSVLQAIVGATFALAGVRAVFRLDATVREFGSWHIPSPAICAPAIAATAIVCGVMLAFGALTRPVALLLATLTIGAALTAGRYAGGLYLFAAPVLFTACVTFAWRAGRIPGDAPTRPPGVQ